MLGRHTAAGRRVALTALGTLVLTGATSAATAAPPPAPASTAAQTLGADRPPAAVLRAMERDLNLKPGQAEERLVNEAEAGARAGRLR
ncbi:S1 family peptidase, partial [Streptomyces sp. NPDC054940]